MNGNMVWLFNMKIVLEYIKCCNFAIQIHYYYYYCARPVF